VCLRFSVLSCNANGFAAVSSYSNNSNKSSNSNNSSIRRCIQNFPDWPPGARAANGTAHCH